MPDSITTEISAPIESTKEVTDYRIRNLTNAGKGRVAGVPNKLTRTCKAALEIAFNEIGGVQALVDWGKANPDGFYALWGKLIPREMVGPNGGPLEVEHHVTVKWGGVEIPL